MNRDCLLVPTEKRPIFHRHEMKKRDWIFILLLLDEEIRPDPVTYVHAKVVDAKTKSTSQCI